VGCAAIGEQRATTRRMERLSTWLVGVAVASLPPCGAACGWLSHCVRLYGRAEERGSILKLSGWIRRHMRKWLPACSLKDFWLAAFAALRRWQRWHNARGRRAALARLGIPPSRRKVAHSSRGAWRMGRSPVMQEALNNRVLKRYGLITPSDLAK
jgi:hypothetical protein